LARLELGNTPVVVCLVPGAVNLNISGRVLFHRYKFVVNGLNK